MEILDRIGNTQLIRLPEEFTKAEATVLAKMEEYKFRRQYQIKGRLPNGGRC